MSRHLIPSSTPHIRQYLLTSKHDAKRVGLQTEYDAEPVIAAAERLRHRTEAASKQGDYRTIAVVPRMVYVQAMREQWDEAAWRRWYNDPANAALRVSKY